MCKCPWPACANKVAVVSFRFSVSWTAVRASGNFSVGNQRSSVNGIGACEPFTRAIRAITRRLRLQHWLRSSRLTVINDSNARLLPLVNSFLAMLMRLLKSSRDSPCISSNNIASASRGSMLENRFSVSLAICSKRRSIKSQATRPWLSDSIAQRAAASIRRKKSSKTPRCEGIVSVRTVASKIRPNVP